MQKVFVQSAEITLKLVGSQLYAIGPNKETPIKVDKLGEIWLHPDTKLTAGVAAWLCQQGVEVVLLDKSFTPAGILHSLDEPNRAALRKRQLRVSITNHGEKIALKWILAKQQAQVDLIKEYRQQDTSHPRRRPWLDVMISTLEDNLHAHANDLLLSPHDLRDAHFAKLYYKELSALMPRPFVFQKRSRQPARDPVNALLNYGYSILYPAITAALQRVGLDPYTGLWHKESDGHPVLAYDIIEAFRPHVDSLVIANIMEGIWKESSFQSKANGAVQISADIRKELSTGILKAVQVGKRDDLITKECKWLAGEIWRLAKIHDL